MKFSHLLIVLFLVKLLFATAEFQPAGNDTKIAELVATLKTDPRGPFKAIRWFCPDGSVLPAKSRCEKPGGIQRAIHKDEVLNIQKHQGIYFGQILAGTDYAEFLDRSNNFSRMKQYALERFLVTNDNGWILRKAQFYRGAYQSEDEEAWGKTFLIKLLEDNTLLRSRYFMCREAVRSLPHRNEDKHLEKIRVLSKTIADSFPSFMDIRIKIHGQPDRSDIGRVDSFRKKQEKQVSRSIDKMLSELHAELMIVYTESHSEKIKEHIRRLPKNSSLRPLLDRLIGNQMQQTVAQKCILLSELLERIREEVANGSKGGTRLQLFDLSIDIESQLFKKVSECSSRRLDSLLIKNMFLARACYGCGFIEKSEWEAVIPLLSVKEKNNTIKFEDLLRIYETHRRIVEWATGMARAYYQSVIGLYAPFEPLSNGFFDDRIHASILLHAGDAVGELADIYFAKAGIKNHVFGLKTQNQCRGLNPGYARGKLVIITGEPEKVDIKLNTIYLMERPPSNLKPVAGIGTVTEGNVVSHVQLLARNLGIPNIVISPKLLSDLQEHNGSDVFFAVSPRGAVTIKPVFEMENQEKELFTGRKELTSKVAIPAHKVKLNDPSLVSLYQLRASHSGSICGPKAANLGQLSSVYPGSVAPGFIIPFAVFHEHMQQVIPGEDISYWSYLSKSFEHVDTENELDEISEENILNRLSFLRDKIKTIPIKPSFIEQLRKQFIAEFEATTGSVPVFIRSDTNVEDLKNFSGAGLNLTVPNIVDEKKLHQAIRDVWASPYTERSFRWRQRFLTNPVNVFPSILVLKSVNCDKSGVMITSGLITGNKKHFTVSFNRGVAGAVDGQAAEMYEINPQGEATLVAPAREPDYLSLPAEGGTNRILASFENMVLTPEELVTLHKTGAELRKKLPKVDGIESPGPFDIELGFLDKKLWLFQVRPYVENRNAKSSRYLRSLDPAIPRGIQVDLHATSY